MSSRITKLTTLALAAAALLLGAVGIVSKTAADTHSLSIATEGSVDAACSTTETSKTEKKTFFVSCGGFF